LSRIVHALATAVRVARAEGLLATRDRLLDRLADARRDRRYLPLSGEASFASPILNLLATPPSPRFGGVPTQLLARLRHEEKERPVALLYPTGSGYRLEVTREGRRGRLDLSGTTPDPTALTDAAFEGAVLRATKLVAARVLHAEGVAGLPLESLLRLRAQGLTLVLSVHDFALFCVRPHLLEQPSDRFCDYSRDPDRCQRCLAMGWRLPDGFQARRRAVAAELLAAADAVVYPSAFLRDCHTDLFGGLEPSRQHVIEPAVDLPNLPKPPPPGPTRHIAYVGAVHAHKGALVFEQVVREMATTPGLRFTVFGGGDPVLLARLRRLPRVEVRGYYRAGSLPALLRRQQVDLALLLSIWPETYGITLDECRAAGVPVVAFDHGAMGERVAREGGGLLVALERGTAGVAQAVGAIASSRPPLARAEPPTPAQGATAFRALYSQLVAGTERDGIRGSLWYDPA
jgi:glycosyltransferase involved in cell wall biosynthesis